MAGRALAFEPALALKKQTLTRKVEYLIFSVLVHYHARCEESFLNWNADLNLVLPELSSHPDLVKSTFMRLANQGAIILRKSSTAPYARCICAEADDHLLCGCP